MTISIIIPTFNEAASAGRLISFLQRQGKVLVKEIIVSDGGSTDNTVHQAEAAGAIVVHSPRKGRAAQMNYGASVATAPLLYFLHADTWPPKDFAEQILHAASGRYHSGCFRLRFDHPHWFLQANCWFTRFDVNHFRFGDQSLFVHSEVFQKVGGFREDHIVLEDQEIIPRIRRHARFIVLPASVTTSARKYVKNGIYKTQAVYFFIYLLYKLGMSQQNLVRTYRSLIKQDKL